MVGSKMSCGFAAAITVAICGFLVGVCGTIAYFAEQYKIKYYTGAHCFVTYSDVIYDCSHASQSSSGRVSSRKCHYYAYWKVEYFVPAMHKDINSNIQGHFGTTRTAALNSAHIDHPIHSNSSCWYDNSPYSPDSVYQVQWEKPDDIGWIIMLCAGYGVFALVLFCCLLIFIVRKCCFTVRHGTAPGNPLLSTTVSNHAYSQNANYQTLRETPVVSVVEEKFKYAPPGPDSEDWA